MKLAYHGGKCCGIKTIFGFQTDPKSEEEELQKISMTNWDAEGGDVNSKARFFHEEAPKETGIERLDRYIEYMEKRRPFNIIEVALAESRYNYLDQTAWFPILEERGFVKAIEHLNSNSGNVVHVFYKTVGEWDGIKGKKDKEVAEPVVTEYTAEEDRCLDDYEEEEI